MQIPCRDLWSAYPIFHTSGFMYPNPNYQTQFALYVQPECLMGVVHMVCMHVEQREEIYAHNDILRMRCMNLNVNFTSSLACGAGFLGTGYLNIKSQ